MKKTTLLVLVLVLVMGITSLTYAKAFNDGDNNYINYIINDDVFVWNNHADIPTTIYLMNGGDTWSINIFETSVANITGGSTGDIGAWDWTYMYIESGLITGTVRLQNESIGVIDGGVFETVDIQVFSDLTICNGEFSFKNNGFLNILGTTTIYGNNFYINGEPILSGVNIYEGGEDILTGDLTGTLEGGDIINIPFVVYPQGTLTLISEEGVYCTEYPSMDANKDCKVDFNDLSQFAAQWLTCNLEPQSACW